MISLSYPNDIQSLLPIVQEIIRRAPDGTVTPLFVDTTNQRVLIGTTSASSNPAKVEVSSGSVKVVTAGYGVIIPAASGNYYLLTIDEVTGEDGSTEGVLRITRTS